MGNQILNLNNLVNQSSNFQHTLSIGKGIIFKFQTATDASDSESQTVTPIYAIGNLSAIAVKAANETFSMTFAMQSGEYNRLMSFVKGIYPNINTLAQLSAINVGMSFNRFNEDDSTNEIWDGIVFSSTNKSIKQNTVETMVTMGFTATNYTIFTP